MAVLFISIELFAQSADYTKYMNQAKKYESEKKWCFALGAYYDALATDDASELKQEAMDSYSELKDVILNGKPGKGKFNLFTIHDEWKELLIDAEKYASSIFKYELTIGALVQGALDYKTRTASYSATVSKSISDRYKKTVGIVEIGYAAAYRDDWSADLPKPEDWPLYSVSSNKDAVYDVNGALIFADKGRYFNAFAANRNGQTLYDYEFNIADESGKEIVNGTHFLLGTDGKIVFEGITPEVMDIIDNSKTYVNPLAVYLQYGRNDSSGNVIEGTIALDNAVFYGPDQKGDSKGKNFKNAFSDYVIKQEINVIDIPFQKYSMSATEVTQELYEAIMDHNPSRYIGAKNPVSNVSWYDAIYFCNKLSETTGKTPVYAVNGTTDVSKWNYSPHQGKEIVKTVMWNKDADGYRLPTEEEWEYAARGGEAYTYAGSDNLDEVGWYEENSGGKTHPVGEKKANGYGLYDMSGNVREWCWNSSSIFDGYRYDRGGSYYEFDYYCEVFDSRFRNAYDQPVALGFRIVCAASEEWIAEQSRIAEEKNRKEAEEAAERKKLLVTELAMITIPMKNYSMSATEVTQELYEAIMGSNPSQNKGEKNPVERVSWYDAIYFCNKLSEAAGKTPVYIVNETTEVTEWNYIPHKGYPFSRTVTWNEYADGYRLPTEEEWEYAANGGAEYTYAGSDNLDEVGWYEENSGGKTHSVAEKKANGYGLYDMCGNVWEWCGDVFYRSNRSYRYCRGGCYYDDCYGCKVSDSYHDSAEYQRNNQGFRVVCSIPN